jgi:hypothetical protein
MPEETALFHGLRTYSRFYAQSPYRTDFSIIAYLLIIGTKRQTDEGEGYIGWLVAWSVVLFAGGNVVLFAGAVLRRFLDL